MIYNPNRKRTFGFRSIVVVNLQKILFKRGLLRQVTQVARFGERLRIKKNLDVSDETCGSTAGP